MKLRKLASVMTMTLLLGLFAGCTNTDGKHNQVEEDKTAPVTMREWMAEYKSKLEANNVTCWYTDEMDKTWLEGAQAEFQKEYGIDVDLVYYDGVQLFEDMNQGSQVGNGPDMYLLGNDQMELAVTTGLAEETDGTDVFWKVNYPDVAKKASTYQGKQYGYPIYFDTYCLVYDANLLEKAPASIDDILAFADEYEDTGSTKAIFRWDIADPYVNTMFLNSYADIFGENGDDINSFTVNNEKTVETMEYFKSLSAYLWMNKNNISHETVKTRIKEKTLVLGLCKTDILDILYEMQATQTKKSKKKKKDDNAGDEDVVNYQISYIPSLTKELSSCAYSTTYSAFVNPYANNEVGAKMFAMYLSLGQAEQQYQGNKKLPVVNLEEQFDEMQSIFYAQYLNSKPVPKVMQFGDYLSESAIAFDAIWDGKDVREQLDRLQETMETKIKK
ncbi:MAG: hypothetical protein Q4D51_06925 [Eubacteriales bacterium]|nr:hypothetical protein [Eubacteriales bacterium]